MFLLVRFYAERFFLVSRLSARFELLWPSTFSLCLRGSKDDSEDCVPVCAHVSPILCQ